MIAGAGEGLIVIALVLDAWFSPPLPKVSLPVLGFLAVSIMQMAKKVRESEGVQIPAGVMKAGSRIAIIEATFAVAHGLCISMILIMELYRAPAAYRQIATTVTLLLFATGFVVFRFTRARYLSLMKAAGVVGAER